MKPESILCSDLLDILFEHRNKLYGAYSIRRNYPKHLVAGLAVLVLLVALTTWLAARNPRPSTLLNNIPLVVSADHYLESDPVSPPPPPPPPPPPLPIRPPVIATTILTTPLIVAESEVTEMPDLEELATHRIGNENIEGAEDSGINVAPGLTAISTAAAPAPPVKPEAAEILESASVMPGFPGGEKALHRWLSRNLKPVEEQLPGQKIRVVARFAVMPDGSIGQLHLVARGGEAHDREVLRVISRMPRWRPGSQAGNPVAVWFSIPIIFEMPEQ